MTLRLRLSDAAHCRAICRRASLTFYRAARRLPKKERDAAFAIYAFCRVTDDLVDTNNGNSERQTQLLTEWKTALAHAQRTGQSNNPILRAFTTTQTHYRIPHTLVHALLTGVESDIPKNQTRQSSHPSHTPAFRTFRTFRHLRHYCWQVAGAVGLMLLHVFTLERNAKARRAAENLGIAMQLTNILRDVNEDYAAGRTYLPQEELQRFHVPLHQLATPQGLREPNAQQLVAFQASRARAYYEKAIDGIARLNPGFRVAILAAFTSYRGILDLTLVQRRHTRIDRGESMARVRTRQ